MYTLAPENGRKHLGPLGLIPVCCLEKRLSHIEVPALDDAVGPRIVPTNPNVSDVVMLLDPPHRRDKWAPIVGDNLADHTPAADEVLHDEVSDDRRGLPTHRTALWVR